VGARREQVVLISLARVGDQSPVEVGNAGGDRVGFSIETGRLKRFSDRTRAPPSTSRRGRRHPDGRVRSKSRKRGAQSPRVSLVALPEAQVPASQQS
jgi:hypothetical protein